MKVLMVLNDPPYGSERAYNGLRLAGAIARQEGHEVKVFLMGTPPPAQRRGRKFRRATTTCKPCSRE